LVEHRLAGRLLEARLMDQRGQVVLIREPEPGVVLECPAHSQLQRAAGVEARGTRVGVHRRFRLRRGLEDGSPLALEKGELAHDALLTVDGFEATTASKEGDVPGVRRTGEAL